MMDDLRAVLRHRDFRLLWGARAATSLGDRIVFIALALYVTDIGSPSDVGLVLAANALPLVLFVLIGGVWADRLERHRVMVVTDVVRAALHGLLAVLIFLGPAPIWAIVVIEAGFGTAQAFFNPAFTGLVPQTVPEDEFQQANAANTIVWNVAELVGPAIATALVLGLGAGWAFTIDALAFVLSAALLTRVRPRSRGERVPPGALLADLRVGWHEVRSRQWVWVVLVATSLALLLALAPYMTLGPTIAEDRYDSTGVFGALAVALGIGTLLGSLAALRFRPRHPIRFAMAWGALWPPVFVLFALGPPLFLLLPLFVLMGFGLSMFDVSWDTTLAERIPPHALSRVSAFDYMGSLALLPLGYVLAGPLGEAFGSVEVLVVGGVLATVAQLLALATPGVWRLQNSPRPSSGVEASA
jgi:predicted MFS family arabinose efflux permease